MIDKKISSLSVGDENSLEGIFTKTDLAKIFCKKLYRKEQGGRFYDT